MILGSPLAHAAAGQYAIHFKDELRISNDLVLRAGHSSSSVRFMCESGGKPARGSTLHLFISHSPDLDGNRSFLSVTLNYGVLRSVRLDERNQSTTEITVPLPPEMLRPNNEITFSVEQFPISRNAPDLWTAIQPASFITVQYEESSPPADLSLLPAPFVDRHSYRPQHLFVLLPDRVSSQTLEATALLIASYAARFGDALTVNAVRSIDAARGDVLMVGMPGEQPIPLFNRLPVRLSQVGKEAGVVALIPKPGRAGSILLVTGNSPRAVSRAARKVIDGHFDKGSKVAIVTQDMEPIPPPARRQWKSFAPPDSHFTLADMGLQEMKFGPENDFSLTLPIPFTPDARFPDYGCAMTLAFRFDSGANADKATLDVSLNGTPVGKLEPAELSADSTTSFRARIPGQLLHRQNVLKLVWRGLKTTPEKDGAAWLLPSSEFVLPRDYRLQLPDLALLQHGLYPFSMRADLSDVMFVLPDDADNEVTAAFLELAGLFGGLVPTDRVAFGVSRRSELNQDSRSFLHHIEFRMGKLPNGTSSKAAIALVQEKAPNAQHYTLTITAPSGRSLDAALKVLFLDGGLKQLRDDTAFVYPNKVVSVRTTPVLQISEYSYFTHLDLWLRENWIALPVILTFVSTLLFVGLRLVLAQYKNRKSAGEFHALDFTSSNGPSTPL